MPWWAAAGRGALRSAAARSGVCLVFKERRGEKGAVWAKWLVVRTLCDPPWQGGLSVCWCCCWRCHAALGRPGSTAMAGLAASSAGTAASSVPSATMAQRPLCAVGPAACATAAHPERPVWTRAGALVTISSPVPDLQCQVSFPCL